MGEQNKKTILLVEDEALVAMSGKMVLEKFGYIVLTAISGEEAITTFKSNKIDLILMDIDLGSGIDGTEAAEIILRDNDIPIVFLSSHTEPEIVEKTEKITSYGYVVKNSGDTILNASIKMAFKLFDSKRKEREKDAGLLESENRYRLLFETTISGFALLEMIYDKKGSPIDCRYIDANPAHEKLTGLKSKDIIGRTARESIGGLEDSWIENYARVDKTGESMTIENYVDGLRRWYKVFAYRPKSGYVAITFEDITERKLTEEMMLQHEHIVSSSTDMMALLNKQFIYISANKAYLEAFKLTPKKLIGKTVAEVFGEEFFNTVIKPHADRCLNGEKVNYQNWFDFPAFDRRYMDITYSPHYSKSNNIIGFVVNGRNITRHKQAEEKIHNQNKFMNTVLESLSHPFYVIDVPDYTIKIANPKAGFKPGLKGKTCYSITHNFDKPCQNYEYQCPLEIVKKTKKPAMVEHIHFDENGNEKNIEVHAHPIFDKKGNVVQLIEYCLDITGRKITEGVLQKALQENKDLLKELQHRAKNSFSMIYNMVHLMKNSSTSDEAKSILDEAASRINVVSEMYDLLYSSDSITEVLLDEYLPKVVNSLAITRGNITIKNNCEAVTMPAKTGLSVGLVAAELITNSIKYAYPGNKKGTITMTLNKTDAGALLEVKDDGVGLPEGFDLSKIDSLGLTLVNVMAGHIKGSFNIESKKGTRCIMKFPIEKKNL